MRTCLCLCVEISRETSMSHHHHHRCHDYRQRSHPMHDSIEDEQSYNHVYRWDVKKYQFFLNRIGFSNEFLNEFSSQLKTKIDNTYYCSSYNSARIFWPSKWSCDFESGDSFLFLFFNLNLKKSHKFFYVSTMVT